MIAGISVTSSDARNLVGQEWEPACGRSTAWRPGQDALEEQLGRSRGESGAGQDDVVLEDCDMDIATSPDSNETEIRRRVPQDAGP